MIRIRPTSFVHRTLAALVAATVVGIAPGMYAQAASDGDVDIGATAGTPTHSDAEATSLHRRKRRVRRTTRTVALRYASPAGVDALDGDLGTLLAARVRSGSWGVLVVSLTRGDTLYAYDPDAELRPASNMKLFTTALALEELGPGHQFSTDVLRAGSVSPDGTLHGDLVLRGDGDPGISRRYYDGGADSAMELLAQQVAGAGIKRVDGSLIADASAFDPQRIPEGWKSRYLHAGYAARVSALSCNENVVTVTVVPGRGRKTAVVSLDPASDVAITGSVRIAAGRGARVMVRSTESGGVAVGGWIGAGSGARSYQVVVEDPTAFTAGAFRHALDARGIGITGVTQFAATPSGAVKIGSLPSPPLARLISAMNRESINHFAELLFRDAARRDAPDAVGSAESANTLLQSFLTTKVGAPAGAVTAADGSGLSTLDRVTARSLVALLAYANRAPWGDAFHASLPVAGESELLRHRMRYTPAQGNLHAKTGTTNDVISLGGYVTARDGELLAFAFVYNGHDRWNAKSTIDAMGATLASFTR